MQERRKMPGAGSRIGYFIEVNGQSKKALTYWLERVNTKKALYEHIP